MSTCRWTSRVESHFDGERSDPGLERHLTECSECATHLAQLEKLRAGVAAVARQEMIADAQFPAFMNEIRGVVEAPRGQTPGFWALLSLSMAALIVALATFAVFFGGPAPVKATEVEFISTDLQGAKVDTYKTEGGVTTVWVTMSKEDLE